MNGKTFEEVLIRFREIIFPEKFDMIIAIANGGIIPAAILNQQLDIQMVLLRINFRDSAQKTKYDYPRLLEPVHFDFKDKSVLLVDDRVKSGSTLQFAVDLLREAKTVKTFAVNGKADYSLYDEDCFKFPWII